ncbi:multicopper oxidase family protein [Aestuariivirga sp.]|uniref:multicopper oxidase family protein n=1 Tax=Aestuariivirga sp. TaxID=2650926 RepID=UPI0035AF5BCD
MIISRRRFVGGTLGFAAFAGPARAQLLTADGFIEIHARKATLGLLEDGAGKTEAWLLGPGPGPAVIRARQGEVLKLRFINDLDREIWLHFFGVRGPTGLMTINVPPGADHAVDCVFTPPDAGTFWIAPMSDQSRLRDMGLTAVLVVEEAQPIPGMTDLVMVLDDWKLADNGAVEGNFGDVEAMVGEGRLGNWFTINNLFRPTLDLAKEGYTRLRVLNAANVRTMYLLFKGQDPMLVARDGQPVTPAILHDQSIALAPGERADLLVSAAEGGIGLALDLFEDIVEIGYLQAPKGAVAPPALPKDFALPPNPLSPLPAADKLRTVTLTLEGGLKGGLTSARLNGAERDLRTLLENGKGWAINGVAGPAAEPLFVATRGEAIRLDIQNRTAFAQPLHIHGHDWQAIGAPPPGLFQDTVVVPAGQTVSLAFVADNPGLWALHSLVAERADGGLVGTFTVGE